MLRYFHRSDYGLYCKTYALIRFNLANRSLPTNSCVMEPEADDKQKNQKFYKFIKICTSANNFFAIFVLFKILFI